MTKKPTYEQALAAVWSTLAAESWQLSSPALKVRHATSPDGRFRLWFKPQTIHYTFVRSPAAGRHTFADARAFLQELDVRGMSPKAVIAPFLQCGGVS